MTAGYLRASLRAVDEAASRPGAPVLTGRRLEAVPAGEVVAYRVPLVAPALLGFRHASVGTSALNTIASSSRVLLPIAPGSATARR